MTSRAALALALALATLGTAAGSGHVGGEAPPPEDDGYEGGPIVVPLYMHILDLVDGVPMNTQPMIDLDLARGFGTVGVAGTPVPVPGTSGNSLRLFGSPGLVEYNATEGGKVRIHPERGISYDVLLDTSKPIVGHLFLGAKAADVNQAGQTGGPEAGLLPLTVRMTMRTQDAIGADLDSGEIIAQGETQLPPDQWPINGAPVEFVVDLGVPVMDRIPGNDSYNVKVEWFNAETPDGAQVVQRDWVLHTGSRYPNRIEIGVVNPLAIYGIQPTPVGNDLLTIHAVMNSPLGNYDVDASKVQLTISGPSTPRNMPEPFVVQRNFEHAHHYAPVEMTWSWPYRLDGAAPGEYTITLTAVNLQGTATATKTATFTIPEGGRAIGYSDTGELVQAQDVGEAPAETPGAALGLVLVAIGAVSLARRTR